MPLNLSVKACTAISNAWGNPSTVADAAFDELFCFGDQIGLDHDDQVRHALNIGVLAGEMKDSTSEEFITAFEAKILNP